VREVIGCVACIEVCRSQANESQPDHEEQRAERKSRFECHQPEQEGEDKPGEDLMVRGEVSLGFMVSGVDVM
jgi:ferredoxin